MTQPVRARNDGEDFHLLWTARRALRLLDKRTELVAIKIEGCSPAEGKGGTSPAELVIDTAEYYGDEDFALADRIEYWQLKHSTVRSDQAWSAAELKDTVAKFAALFAERCRQYGDEAVESRLRFVFLSNRPIDERALDAVEAGRSGESTSPLLKIWKKACGLDKNGFTRFLRLLRLEGRAPAHGEQDAYLRGELAAINPSAVDANLRDRLVEFVRSKTLTPAAGENGINVEGLLNRLGAHHQDELFPAQPAFEEIGDILRRGQETEIAKAIVDADAPVLIHATGGIGKSVLARRLPELLPEGSVTVVFDGFAGGAYRQSIQPRHRHSQGIVQIVNELAEQGWCDLLLPDKTAASHSYLRTFEHRLKQASQALQQQRPGALLTVVLDAADNSEDAAREKNEAPSFARDLLQRAPPPGCRLVVLARTERRDRFPDRHRDTIEIALAPFLESESGLHLKRAFPEALPGHVGEFHRYTGGNPRIQSYLLKRADSLGALLHRLGPSGLSVDEQIRLEVEAALADLRQYSGDESGIQALCAGLASLPPRVPTTVLAKAAGVEQAAIDTFVAGLGQALIHLDGFVQFRDEPVETWFRETFRDERHAGEVLGRLAHLAETDAYVASAWPGLLFQAGRMEELFRHALGVEPRIEDALERRAIVRERLRFALRVAGQREDWVVSTELLLRLAEIRAAEERQQDILFSNDDLVAVLWPSEQVVDMVFRQRAGAWYGIAHARYAAMLARLPGHQAEARQSLRQAEEWLQEWAKPQPQDHNRYRAQTDDIAAFASAHLFIRDAEHCVGWINRWKAPEFRFQIAHGLAARLIDSGEVDAALALSACAAGDPHVGLGLVQGMAEANIIPKQATLLSLAEKWAPIERDKEKSPSTNGETTEAEALVVLAEAMAYAGVEAATVLAHLERHLPEMPRHSRVDDVWSFENYRLALLIRAYCLRAVLKGVDLDAEDLLPEALKRDGKPMDEVRDADRLLRMYGLLLPWYRLRAELLAKHLGASESASRVKKLASHGGANDWRWGQEASYWANHIAKVWWDILSLAGAADAEAAQALETWLGQFPHGGYTTTWIHMARLSAHSGQDELALRFAALADQPLRESHEDAESDAKTWLDLARAVLPASRDEARVYFEQGLAILEKQLGQESRDWFETLGKLADRGGRSGDPQPELAYRFARAAEQVNAHNSHKFNWPDVAENLVKLCPASALAIAGRWQDRRCAYLYDTLAGSLPPLVRCGAISSGQALALRFMTSEWNRNDLLEACLSVAGDAVHKAQLLDIFVQELAVAAPDQYATKTLRELAVRHGLVSPVLEALHARPPDPQTRRQQEDRERYAAQRAERENPEPLVGDFTRGAEIDRVMEAWHADKQHRGRDEVSRQMLETIPLGKRVDHLRAWYEAETMSASDVLFTYQDIGKVWDSPAVRKEIKRLTDKLIAERSGELLASRFGVGFLLGRRWGERHNHPVEIDFRPLLDAAAQQAGFLAAEPFFQLTQELVLKLGPEQAREALDFSLQRIEMMQADDLADGVWRQALTPPEGMADAIAGFIWARLAAPEAEERWRAAHAVRALCRLGEQATLAALIGLFDTESGGAFADASLPFYALHARLYLMIALARAARESPAALRPHAALFSRVSLEGVPHVLMRAFAVDAALALEKAFPGVYPQATLDDLDQVNRSALPPSDERPVASARNRQEREHFWFYLDIEPYWFSPLGYVFGIPDTTVSDRADSWIDKLWGKQRPDDPRGRQYQDRETRHSHGSYPKTDRLDFYLAYHAMFCVAGEFLAERPVLADRWEAAPFDSWLRGHQLTRNDGDWLADRRDPLPLERRPWESEADSDTWRWEIARGDFEMLLGIQDGLPAKLPVWGEWHFAEGSRGETIEVASALVKELEAQALLVELQSRIEPHWPYLMAEREEGEDDYPSALQGWISSPSPQDGLDCYDPFGGRLPYPTARPGAAIRRMAQLSHDSGYRLWRTEHGETAFSAELWGDRSKDRSYERPEYGSMLFVHGPFLLEMLSRLQRMLMVEVRISRHSSWRDREAGEERLYPPPYVRFFLIDPRGAVF